MNRVILILLNVCLAGIVCVLARKLYNVWDDTYALPTMAEQASVESYNPRRQSYTEVRKPNDNYDIIVEKDLFSENRSCNEGTETLTPPSQIVLRGCFIYGKHKAALLDLQEKQEENVTQGRSSKASRNKELREVTVGDTIAGYQVANILEDKVILKDNAGKTCIVQIEIPKERNHLRTEVTKARETTVPNRGTSHKTVTKSPPTRDRHS